MQTWKKRAGGRGHQVEECLAEVYRARGRAGKDSIREVGRSEEVVPLTRTLDLILSMIQDHLGIIRKMM